MFRTRLATALLLAANVGVGPAFAPEHLHERDGHHAVMRSVVLCATFAAFIFPSAAAAQALSLTEAEALQRLSESSPRVRVIRAAIDLARTDMLAAGRWPNPRVTVDREPVGGNTEYLTMVGQLLPAMRPGSTVSGPSGRYSISARIVRPRPPNGR